MQRAKRNKINILSRREPGQAMVVTTIAVTVLLAAMAMAIDVGFLRHEKKLMQTAADAAALAGAAEMKYGTKLTVWEPAAQRAATQNNFTNGQNNVVVTVNNPPASGRFSGNANYLEAVVRQPQPTYFMKVLGFTSVPVAARAVADLTSAKNCIYIMDPSGSAVISNDETINSSCGIVINTSSANPIRSKTIIAPSVSFVSASATGYGALSVIPTKGIVAPGDPLGYLPAQTPGSCINVTMPITTATTLSAGTYCGGITISKGVKVTLNPGTYILNGGGLNITASGATLSGTGVTFYNTGTAATYKPINMADGTTLNLSAPTSGPLEGILFFQDRSILVANGGTNILPGQGLTGALYFPTSTVQFSEGSVASVSYTIIVAYRLNNQINTLTINNDVSSLADGSPIKATVLAE